MRKGFTRKPQGDEPATPSNNYITPGGLQRLKDEHRFLLTRERPAVTEVVAWAAGNGDRSENADYQYGKRRLRQIDGRIRFLTKRIESAEVVDPETPVAPILLAINSQLRPFNRPPLPTISLPSNPDLGLPSELRHFRREQENSPRGRRKVEPRPLARRQES
jgi:hypothetical protein